MARSEDEHDARTTEELIFQLIGEVGTNDQPTEEVDHSQADIYVNMAGDGNEEQPIAKGGNEEQQIAEGGNDGQQSEVEQLLYVNIIWILFLSKGTSSRNKLSFFSHLDRAAGLKRIEARTRS